MNVETRHQLCKSTESVAKEITFGQEKSGKGSPC